MTYLYVANSISQFQEPVEGLILFKITGCAIRKDGKGSAVNNLNVQKMQQLRTFSSRLNLSTPASLSNFLYSKPGNDSRCFTALDKHINSVFIEWPLNEVVHC